jgi:hypothetical protein
MMRRGQRWSGDSASRRPIAISRLPIAWEPPTSAYVSLRRRPPTFPPTLAALAEGDQPSLLQDLRVYFAEQWGLLTEWGSRFQ